MRKVLAWRLLFFCVISASVACLAASYVAIGLGIVACVVLVPPLFLLFRSKARGGWPAHVYLAATVSVAAAAALAGAPALLVVPGGALALAAWDLAEHERFLRDGQPRNTRDSSPGSPEMKGHVITLGKAIAVGLLAAGVGMALPLRIPFWLMLPLVIVDLACLVCALRLLRH